MNPVATSDVAARWHPLSADEEVRAQALIDDAWEELLERIPGIQDRLALGSLRPGLVIAKVSAAVIPFLRNPEGWVDEEEAIDDYRSRRRRGGDVAAAAWLIPDASIEALKGVTGQSYEIVPCRW